MSEPLYHFSLDGDRFDLGDPCLIRSADSDLWNDRTYLQIDHRGKVLGSGWLTPDLTPYSLPLRTFYLRDNDSGEIWTVPQGPVRTEPESFKFSAGTSDISWVVSLYGIRCTVRVVIPPDDPVELWTVDVENCSQSPRSLSLFSYFPIGKPSWLRNNTRYEPDLRGIVFDFFPYYVDYRDYYKLRDVGHLIFAVTDTEPDGWMWSIEDFIGHGTAQEPDALRQPVLPKADRWADAETDSAAIFQFNRTLTFAESLSVQFAFGPGDGIQDPGVAARRYMVPGGVVTALREMEKRSKACSPAICVRTPDRDFDAYVNHWLPRRSLMLVRAMRFMSAPQGRNLLQDSMAGSLIDPASSRRWFLKFYSFQKENGWLPHGMPLEKGATQLRINTVPHKDINSWGPSAIVYYLNETGDQSILSEPVPFSDAPETQAPLYNHVCRGLGWLLADRTPRGLSRIGQGDWNDPLNMAGHGERGESIWLSEALVFALETWAPVCVSHGDTELASEYLREAGSLRKTINELAWDGEWYVRGFTDEGIPFGSSKDTEGRIFLNAQSWAIMSGTADSQRTRACIAAIDKYLETPSGPMMLAPAYTKMREDIGKLTQKSPGRLENGSVYSHAATFYAYALYQAREPARAFQVLRKLLTGSDSNPLTRSGQLPLYIPNSYYGTPCGDKAGLSTHSANTGTAAWYYRTVVDCLFGLRAESDGLRIDPQLPPEWQEVFVRRRWRGATFDVVIRRSQQVSTMITEMNGINCPNHLIPVQPANSNHSVMVLLPLHES